MKWLRKIIADEVAKVEGRLKAEREEVASYISVHAKSATNILELEVVNTLHDIEKFLQRQIEISVQNFKETVVHEASEIISDKNKALQDAHEKLQAAHVALAKVSHWKADNVTVEADHSLKLVK